jgi:hypothetical protein
VKSTDRLIGILDSSQENQRLELVIETEGTPKLALRLVTYAKGLGWNTQKTIYIDNQQAEELQFLLGGARSLLKQATRGQENNPAQASEQSKTVRQFKTKNLTLSQRKSA